MDKETKALINFYDNKIKDLEDKNKEKQNKLDEIEEYFSKKINKELEYLYKKNDNFHKGKDFGDGSYGCAIQDVQAIKGNILQIIKGEDK